MEADEKELEKEEAEEDQPGDYMAMEIVDKKLNLALQKKRKKARRPSRKWGAGRKERNYAVARARGPSAALLSMTSR